MAVLFLDGCNHLSAQSVPKKYTYSSNYASGFLLYAPLDGRFADGALTGVGLAGQFRFTASLTSAVSTLTTGMYFHANGGAAVGTTRILLGHRRNNQHVVLLTVCDGTFQIRVSAADVSVTSSVSSFNNNAWNLIEMRTNLSTGSTGNVAVHVCGVEFLSYTGPINSAVSKLDMGLWGTMNTGVTQSKHDDFWIVDDAGPVSGFIGPTVRVRRIRVSADSTPLQWDASSGGNHFVEVDDLGELANTDLVSTSVSGEIDAFNTEKMSGLFSANEVPLGTAVTVAAYGSGSPTMAINLVLSGNTLSATHALTASWMVYQTIFNSAPGYVSWAVSNTDNLDVSVEYV